MLVRADIDALSDAMKDAEALTREQSQRRQIETEPAFTARFLGAAAMLMDERGHSFNGL